MTDTVIVFGDQPGTSFNTEGLLLETDLAHPLSGPPGVIGLYQQGSILKSYFMGHHTPKHCVQRFLEGIELCVHEYMRNTPESRLFVHCHNWTSGIGKVLLADIMRLVRPSSIIEYYTESPRTESIYSITTSFLQGVYPLVPANCTSIKQEKVEIKNHKSERSRAIHKYFQVHSSLELIGIKPFLCFISDVEILLDRKPLDAAYHSALLGKICGLSIKTETAPECRGLGIIRDVNLETGMLYLITPVQNIQEVDTLEITTGETAIELTEESLTQSDFLYKFEHPSAMIVQHAILTEKLQKHHPGRKV